MKLIELVETLGLRKRPQNALRLKLKMTDEFTEEDAMATVHEFAIREGGWVENTKFGEGEFSIVFETEEEAEQAKKTFRRLSRMRPGFTILDYGLWSYE
ncbi:hypothetical protein LCGC14_2715650, partial [marine sediment metagenome]